MPSDNNFDKLVTKLIQKQEDIKDYYFMVEWLGTGWGNDCYDFEADDELDEDEKWKRISDMFRGFGFSPKKFSYVKCRGRFYEWSAFYAKNYDKLNGKLTPNVQEIFDNLKIVHILDLSKIWVHTNSNYLLLKQISLKDEIKEYLLPFELRKLELNEKKRNIFNVNINARVLTFEDMNLSDDLLRGIRGLSYHKPSYIQQRSIIPFIKGRDVIAQAQSGTGKTAAFGVAILQLIDTSLKECQALILAPTRELAQQIHKEISHLGKYMRVRCYNSIGGTHTREDANNLSKGFQVVVGTPGRILDMMQRKALRTQNIKYFVLDESDQLLDLSGRFVIRARRGFQNQIFDIFKQLKPSIQVFLSSATMPPEVLQMSQFFMRSPVRILVKDEELTLEGLQQFYVNAIQEDYKYDTFLDLYLKIRKSHSFESSKSQIFVYCNTKNKVNMLVQTLETKDQIIVAHMHSGMFQNEREQILHEFRNGSIRILITTDLLGRGIDVKDVEIVINYDMPENRETYMHRVGRSGRFGRTGKAINLITEAQMNKIDELQKFYNTEINELPGDLSSLF